MPEAPKCPQCGSPLPGGGWKGLCPDCVVRVSLGIPPAAEDAATFSERGAPELPHPLHDAPIAGESPEKSDALSRSDFVSEQTGAMIGRYKLLENIGEGGMGVVWMAEQEEPVRRRVALKIIKLGMDTREVIARFEAERQALALMDHSNIAKVYDGGATDTGRPYFVMELVRGVRITDYCDQHNLSTGERLDLFIQTCHAIQHAHQKGIIHRDIKPSNILVTVNDGRPVPKIIDFGIAKATELRLTDKTLFTAFRQFLGTPAYMSPEQAEMTSLNIDTRSDIYSLGVLLYELLTGKTPFDAKELLAAGLEAMRRVIREKEPVRPSTRLSTMLVGDQTEVARRRHTDPPRLINLLRGDLDWIVMKCLEKDRTCRYETSNEIAQDIQRHLNSEAVVARPPTASYLVGKFVRKHRTAVAVAAAFVLLLAAAAALSTGLAIWANRERTDAIKARKEVQTKAEAEAEAKSKAQTEQKRAENALAQIQIQRAQEYLANQQGLTALTYLARVLRDDRSNRVAAEMLLATLTYRGTPIPLAESLQHSGVVRYAEFSPDGQRIVTASSDRTARVWDARTGQPLTEPLQHEGSVKSARFSPDGQRIVTACVALVENVPLPGRTGGYARVWDARTGQPLTEPLKHRLEVNDARFSPDGQRVVTAAFDFARVWDVRTGQVLTQVLELNSNVQSADFSPDGQRFVTVGIDKSAWVWDAHTGQALTGPLKHTEVTHWSPVSSVQFSPDGQRVVTASFEGTARVWDARTGQPLTPLLKHNDLVYSAQFSPDGERVVTASRDKTARVWDAHTGQALCEPLRHNSSVGSAEFSPDGQRIVTASDDHTARVWDVRTGMALGEPLQHEGPVNSAKFSPDGQHVVTASNDGSARVWDVRNGQALTERIQHDAPDLMGWTAQFSTDGQRVVTSRLSSGWKDSYARVWDPHTVRPLTKPLEHLFGKFARFSPDGKMILTGSGGGLYSGSHVWDALTGKALTELEEEAGIWWGEFSPDSQRVVTATSKGARVWDARTGRILLSFVPHNNIVNSAQFSVDGQRLLTASSDRTARIWDARTGQPLTEPLKHDGVVWSAQFSSNGQQVVTASSDGTARVWDAFTGQALTEPLQHNGSVTCAQFSPDGQRVVTACGSPGEHEGYARIWDARTGQALTEPLKHNASVHSAQFSPDGQRVVTASLDQTARVWDAHTGQAVMEPLKHKPLKHNAAVGSAQFSPDGQRVLTAAPDGVRLWDVPTAPLPIPDWLADLAEAAAGHRLNQKRLLEPVPHSEVLRLKQKLANTSGSDVYSVWVRWYLADRGMRTISPFSAVTMSEYVQRRIQEDTLDSLQDAVRVSPTNGPALARLARLTLAAKTNAIPEADFLSRFAVKWAPNDAEVARIRAEIEAQVQTERP